MRAAQLCKHLGVVAIVSECRQFCSRLGVWRHPASYGMDPSLKQDPSTRVGASFATRIEFGPTMIPIIASSESPSGRLNAVHVSITVIAGSLGWSSLLKMSHLLRCPPLFHGPNYRLLVVKTVVVTSSPGHVEPWPRHRPA